ncbi:MAG: DUF1553 domain-containing protein [Planctomycetota bacterium]
MKRSLCLALLLACTPLTFAANPPDSTEFFENRIRPILVKHCYKCHSEESDEIGGSLWLDSAGAMRDGGDSGPAIEPGDPDASLLVSAIRYESMEMPPEERLPNHVIADFVKWIEAGAKDPRTGTVQKPKHAEIDFDAGRQFWAFQPIADFRSTLPPQERDAIEDRLIDAVIDKRLGESAVTPGAVATPAARLRRLSFDLTGLPPSESLRTRWLAEPTAENWSAAVEELIESRAFAQHWGRHWLDIARYADSNGSDFNATYHEAWRYRDYVIDSFDRDRPLDQFIRQQVAGDLLPAANDDERHDNIVASTFLMLGTKMLSERDKVKLTLDVVDEQIDTIGRAFLGMTLGCARCHDHKFDPIATEDYYALAGIFKSTQTIKGESQKYVSTWNRVPLPASQEHHDNLNAYATSVKKLEEDIKRAKANVKSVGHRGVVIDDADAKKVGKWVDSTFSKGYVGVGYVHDNNAEKGAKSIEFRTRLPKSGRYAVRVAYAASGNRAPAVPVTVVTADGTKEIILNQREAGENNLWFSIGEFEFSADEDAVVTLRNKGTTGYVIADAVQFLDPDDAKVPTDGGRLSEAQRELKSLQADLKKLKANKPPALPEAMAPSDLAADQIADSPVHIRGEPKNLGETVPRGFLTVCSSGDAAIEAPAGSGRLELAHWLTDPDHPLVARVMVNRVWSHLFGEGIVRTVDNFGSRGERPSHPQLLDALALDLMRDGWKLKPLIRKIVGSEAYSRASSHQAAAAAIDPENRLLWRAHRKRLTAESIRDTMVLAAGRLTDEEPTEPVANKGTLVTKNNATSVAVGTGIEQPIRTLYLPLIRGHVSELLSTLDAADPDLLVGKRPTTNVPAQTLVLLNHDSVNQWAGLAAARIVGECPSLSERIDAAYRCCLSRDPHEEERAAALDLLDARPDAELATRQLTDLIAAMFASTEFRLLD